MFKRPQNIFIFGGIFFLGVSLLVTVRNFFLGFTTFYWYCDFVPFLFSLLFFIKAPQAIKGLINIGLFPQLVYSLSLLGKLLFGTPLFGFTFELHSSFITIVTLLIHFGTLVAFFLTFKIRPQKLALLYSFLFALLIYVTVLTFTRVDTSVDGNYNLIYYSDSLSPHLKYYTVLWVPLLYFIIILPTHGFQLLIYSLYHKYHAPSEPKIQ